MPLLSSSPSRPNIAPGSRLCPTTFRTAPPLKPCRPSTNSISTNSRRSNRPEASAAISTLARTPIHRVAQVGKQAPPTRAALSLVRALRGARGALLFATWTTLCRRHKGVLVARRSGGPFARRLTHTPSRTVIAEDVRDLQSWSSHGRGLRRRRLLGVSPHTLAARPAQAIEWALDLGNYPGRNAGIAGRRLQLLVSEQRLNQPNVRAALKQMGREAVAKRMQGERFTQPRCFRCLLEQPSELACGQR